MLFQLLTGVIPFPRDQEAAKIFAHLNSAPPVPSSVVATLAPEYDVIVARAMAKDGAERFQSAGDLARELSSAAEAEHYPTRVKRIPPASETAPGMGRGGRPAIFNVPVMTRTFVGRHEPLGRLAAGLMGAAGAAGTQVQAIHGIGGVGKSQLAARYAREHRDDYDVVWWLHAEQPQTLRADLAQLAVALGVVAGSDVDEQAAVSAAVAWLERNGRWLLVFDNATDPEAIADVLPEGSGGHMLITSRTHADWRALQATPLALEVWERTESRAFLSQRTGEPDTTVLDDVAAALGDLPLALEQAAAYTNRQAITLATYAQRLRDRAPELFTAGQPPTYEHTVATTWSLALDQIAQHPIADRLLAACAYLAPERIPRELLGASAGGVYVQQGVDGAIELLLGYGLLTAATEQTLNMHRLIQQVARARDDSDACQQAAASAVVLLRQAFPEEPWEPEHWPACQRLLSHGLVAAGYAQAFATAPAATAGVLLRLGQYQTARAEFASARDLMERALAIFESVHGREHIDVAMALTSLGLVMDALGELPEARATEERALAIKEALYGPEHPQVARTLCNLGNVLAQMGELATAQAAEVRALAIFEHVYGPDDSHVAMTLGNLGDILRRLGDLRAARSAQERALAIFETVNGPDHGRVAITLTDLGNVLEQLDDLPAARAAHQRSLAIKEDVYGPEHPEVAITLTHLGQVLERLDDLPAAHGAQQRALAIFEAVHGSEHPEVAATLTRLSHVLERLGDLPAAHATQERARQISAGAAKR